MKNLLLILLLANILYFLWASSRDEDPEPGVTILREADLGPPLSVTTLQDSDSIASVGMAIDSGEPSALLAIQGPACVSIGPFLEGADADSAVLEYANDGMRTARRSRREDTFVGHWVQIRDIATDAEATVALRQLSDGGLSDAYKVVTEDEGIKISLGLFGDIERAERVELQARSLELAAEISPRLAERSVFYVDVRLPQGRGVAVIVDRFGEDMVKTRDRATCP